MTRVHICQFSGPTVELCGWRFEFSEQFGPLVLNKDDTPKKNQPGERSPFWRVFNEWLAKGGYGGAK